MPEIPKREQPKPSVPKARSRRSKSQPEDAGIYLSQDSAKCLLSYAVPTLAYTLDADEDSFRALIGKTGTINRDATIFTNDSDTVNYDVLIDRAVDTDDRGKKFGRITLQITVTHYHKLSETELIAEWPLLEECGVADDLVKAAAQNHSETFRTEDDVDLDDPMLNTEMMFGQARYLVDRDDDETESLAVAMFGTEVERYFEKKLRITTDHRPSLVIKAGYQSDESSFGLKIGNNYSLSLIGDTPSELAIMAQLGTETFVLIDSEAMQEFIKALEVVEVLKRTRKRKK